MSDRELLELAAKAAQIRLEWLEDYCFIPDDDPEIDPMWRLINGWNPLEDDGDALRLAAKLSLSMQISPCLVRVWWGHLKEVKLEVMSDRAASTRHAIVQAAAEIGKDESC